MIFEVESLQKTTQNRCKNAFEKNIEKKHPKNRFGVPFWPPKTSQNPSKIEKKTHSKQIFKKGTRTSMDPYPDPLRPTPQGKPKRPPKSHPFA